MSDFTYETENRLNKYETYECPYGIIKTNGESRIKSRVLRFILIYFSSFSNPKFTRFSSLITVMLS